LFCLTPRKHAADNLNFGFKLYDKGVIKVVVRDPTILTQSDFLNELLNSPKVGPQLGSRMCDGLGWRGT